MNPFLHFCRLSTLVVASLGCYSLSIQAATLYVTPQETIQSVINQAQAGDTVEIAPGTYHEVVTINTPQLTIIGQGKTPDAVIIESDHDAKDAGDALQSATVFAHAPELTMSNLSIVNNYHQEHPDGSNTIPAIALLADGDKQIFTQLHITGYQNTLYAGTPVCPKDNLVCPTTRQFFKQDKITGAIDLVFGDAYAWFEQVELHGIGDQEVTLTAQSKANLQRQSGYVFHLSTITADKSVQQISLGRPAADYSTVNYIDCMLDKRVVPEGFTEWDNTTFRLKTAQYLEFGSMGPGASPNTRFPQMLEANDERLSHVTTSEMYFDEAWKPEADIKKILNPQK